jgi:GNAT superfamily N-acetyltransferase
MKQVSGRDAQVTLRPARSGDGKAVLEVTQLSVAGLARGHYSEEQISGWMGERTPAYYEDIIAHGLMVVAERGGVIVGFVDSEPGELTRLFILPEAAGSGLGKRLLEIGIEHARRGSKGGVKVEATLNAVQFYERFGFKATGTGHGTHTLGGPPIPIVHMELVDRRTQV